MIKPLNRNIIVKEEEFKEQTEDGLILTTTTSDDKTKVAFGLVIATSEELRGGKIIEGTRVAFSPYAGSRLTIEGQDFLVLNEEDLVGYE
jgi:chaperonin GroES